MSNKLTEVALPLRVINHIAAREKSIRHGHHCTVHIWRNQHMAKRDNRRTPLINGKTNIR